MIATIILSVNCMRICDVLRLLADDELYISDP